MTSRFIDHLPPRFWLRMLLCSVGFALYGSFYAYNNPVDNNSVFWWLASILLVLAFGFFYDYQAPSPPAPTATSTRFWGRRWFGQDAWDWLLILVITLLAYYLRVHNLDQNLPPMHGDEGEKGVLAWIALHGTTPDIDYSQPVPLFSTRFFGHPTLYHYMQAIALWLMGDTLIALRIMNAFFGALAAGTLYILARTGWGRWAGFFAGWFMAVSHTYIHYSRTAMSMIPTVFAIILMATIFAQAYEAERIRKDQTPTQPRKILRFVLIGLTIGWSQYMYFGSRLLPVLALIILFYLLLRRSLGLGQFLALGFGFFAIYSPLGYYFYHHPDKWIGRLSSGAGSASGLSLGALQRVLGPAAVWPDDIPRYVLAQLVTNVRYFIDRGDVSTFYWSEVTGYDQWSVICIGIGLLLALLRFLRYHEFVALAWTVVGVFLAGVMTIDSPYGPRLIIAMPGVFLLAGLSMQTLYNWLSKLKFDLRFEYLLLAGVVAGQTLLLNYDIYFVRYPKEGPIFVPELAAHELLAQPDAVQAFFLTSPDLYQNHGDIKFLARLVERYDLPDITDYERVQAEHPSNKPLLFIIAPNRVDEYELLRQRFPNGSLKELLDNRGAVRLFSYRVER